MVTKNKANWLPHLENSVTNSASITGVSLYTIALEGWRRGLKLKFFSDSIDGDRKKIKYTLEDGIHKYTFDDSSGNLNSEEAVNICGDKGITNKYLQQNNVPIPLGKHFDESHTLEEMLNYAKKLNYPLVVKPVDGLGGTGVFVNIKEEKELINAIQHLQNKLKFKRIIIQEFIKGEEIRIYVLNHKVIAAANRIPAYVVGDGVRTVASLIHEKNKNRKRNPNLRHRLINMDTDLNHHIENLGYTLDTVLEKNERLNLRQISNVSLGGDPVDYTDFLTEEQKKIAEEATKAVPGLKQCGVDMMINKKTGRSVILELNASPGIGTHLFPVYGTARDIPKYVIDFYFPNSEPYDKEGQLFYFDLSIILDPLLTGFLREVEVPDYPKDYTNTRMFNITIVKEEKKVIEELFHKVRRIGCNGYIKKLGAQSSDTLEFKIVINHKFREKLQLIREKLSGYLEVNKILNMDEQPYANPLKIGFHYYKENETKESMTELELSHLQLYREYRISERELHRVKKGIKHMKESTSWKVTKPLRLIKDIINK